MLRLFKSIFHRRLPDYAQDLVAVARLWPFYISDGRYGLSPDGGRASRFCFARKGSSELFGCYPGAFPTPGMFYSDKFLTVRAGHVRGLLGEVELREDYVYDEHYRSEIDYTGVQLVLTLRKAAFAQYEQFVSNSEVSGWAGVLVVRVPAPIFEFPAGRGSPPPYPSAGGLQSNVGKLRTIKKFEMDTLDVIKMRPSRGAVDFPLPVPSEAAPGHALRLR